MWRHSPARIPNFAGTLLGRRPAPRAVAGVALAILLVAVSLASGYLAPQRQDPATQPSGPTGPVPNRTAPTPAPSNPPPPNSPASNCNPSTPTPSAVLIPLPNPPGAPMAGGRLGASYEIAPVSPASARPATTVFMPSAFATFPLSDGSIVSIYISPRSVALPAAGWTDDSWANQSQGTNSAVSFAPSSAALLSTQKLAVMATADYGNLTLEVRWRWTETDSRGATTLGPWSSPTATSAWPTALASVFYPAPYVSLLASSGPNVTIGTDVSSVLGGSVASRSFFQELETPGTGHVFQSAGATAPSGVDRFNLSIPMINYDHYLDPGTYLLHLHDDCGAILYNLAETATFAAWATVTVSIEPSACGPVTINGTAHASGTSFSFRPTASAIPFSVPSCPGHSFQDWAGTGGVHVLASGSMRISSDGTFTVRFS